MNAVPELPRCAAALHWSRAQTWIGSSVTVVESPSLVIDLDAMERNLARMAAFAATRSLLLRPHAKTHKSGELALLQMASGAVGVCVQKVDEALALSAAGVKDIYISNQVIAQRKLERLAQAIAMGNTRFSLAVDSEVGIARLASSLLQAGVQGAHAADVMVEVDVGQGRCGAESSEAALQLVQSIGQHACLRFAGLQAYQGSAQHLRTIEARDTALAEASRRARETLAMLAQHGIEVPLITGAGTGSLTREAQSGLWGELQPGSYLFMDADYAGNEIDPCAPKLEHALFVKSEVMSAGAAHAVCDAGHKSHAIDSGLPTVAHPKGLSFANGGDEHGLLHAAGGLPLPAIGASVWLIPGHCDPTVNLHDFYVGVRGGILNGTVERIIAIDARGATG